MADIDQEDPDKIKDNLMDLCDHKKAEFVLIFFWRNAAQAVLIFIEYDLAFINNQSWLPDMTQEQDQAHFP